MFYPQQMTEVEMVVPAKDLLAVTDALAGQGMFHQADARYLSSETGPGSPASWQETALAYAALERRIVVAMQILGVKQEPMPPAEHVSIIEIPMVRLLLEQIESEIQTANEQLIGRQKRLEQLNSYLRQLEPIADVDIDIHTLCNPHHIFSRLGVIPAANLERLQTSLRRIPFVLLTLRQDDQKPVVWLAGARRDADILDRAARSAYLDPLKIPPIHHGTPADVIASLHIAIKRSQRRLSEQEVAMKILHEAHGQRLQALLWRVRASRMLASAISRFGRLRYTYLIFGWVPSHKLAGFVERIKQTSGETLIDTLPAERIGAKQDIPIALHESGVLGAFQSLVTTYAQPRYEEVDPTLLMAITFPLLFGAMFGDVGHGLILALLGWLLASRRIRALNSMASLGTIIVACGLSATVFGFLYGSVFGEEGLLPALWIRPMQNIMQILLVAVGAGVVLLSLGLLLNILNAWKARNWGRLIFAQNGIAGLVFYWSLLGLGIGALTHVLPVPSTVFVVPAAAGGLAIMFSEVLNHLIERHRPLIEGGIATYIVQAVFELFETFISFLSNSLSYVRVGAFAVAHGGLSAVIFILAEMISPGRGVGYWIVVALGSLFIVGFEGLIVGIQTMRLEYYEFFCKFFEGGGKPYKPLTLQPTTKEQNGMSF
jgi:V/A-type H+-transporting ATPase subunit I